MRFAPIHQPVAGKTRVAAQDDARVRPAVANARDAPGQHVDRALRRVAVRGGQLGDEHMVAPGHVQRQVAIAAVVAVKQLALLIAMHRVVRRVKVQHDLLGRFGKRIEEQIEENVSNFFGSCGIFL